MLAHGPQSAARSAACGSAPKGAPVAPRITSRPSPLVPCRLAPCLQAAAAPSGQAAVPSPLPPPQPTLAAGTPGSGTGAQPSGSGTGAQAVAAAPPAPVRIPQSIYEVDNGSILGFGADLSADHPGFHDEDYKKRRYMLAQQAKQHRIGDPIPDVAYTREEVETWGKVLAQLQALLPQHACKEYMRTLPRFNFTPDRVPQLQEMSEVLERSTGWRIRPVAGLMHPREFLAGLAFRHFHSTQYMRHPSRPDYTPEPDVCHELIGHVPMLADPACADLIETIGKASLGADDSQIWHLTKVYWYTVEFGVVHEGGDIKAFGAGILSSYGELQHMAAGGAALQPFNPFAKQPKMSYKDGFQKRYFALDSFERGAQQLRDYAAVARLPEALRGDPSVA